MRRDRDGSELEAEDSPVLGVAELRHLLSCRAGWLREDTEGRPVPCRVCRPHLAWLNRRLQRELLGPWAA